MICADRATWCICVLEMGQGFSGRRENIILVV